jgi:hypothetical protein
MAQTTVSDRYEGMVEEDLSADQLAAIFDAIWGPEARSLPFYPEVLGGVIVQWVDGDQVTHKAEHLDELLEAFREHQTASISFDGQLEGKPQARFLYRPGARRASISASASEAGLVRQAVDAVKAAFPLAPRFVFISYATIELDLAVFVAELLERRLSSTVTVFVAKLDIGPGKDPRKTMLEEQLLRAEALVAICSVASKQSGWLWWEASSVWTRRKLVLPLFTNISPGDFDGPLTMVCQGRQLFDPPELSDALGEVVSAINGEPTAVVFSEEERERLDVLSSTYG